MPTGVLASVGSSTERFSIRSRQARAESAGTTGDNGTQTPGAAQAGRRQSVAVGERAQRAQRCARGDEPGLLGSQLELFPTPAAVGLPRPAVRPAAAPVVDRELPAA